MDVEIIMTGWNPITTWQRIMQNPRSLEPLYLPKLNLRLLTGAFAEKYTKVFPWHFKDSMRSLLTAVINNPTYEFSYFKRMHESLSWSSFMRNVANGGAKNVVSTWRVSDYTNERIPCLMVLAGNIHGESLDLSVVFRSRDLAKRMIPNWYSLAALQVAMAKELKTEVGTLNDLSIKTFVKDEDMARVKTGKLLDLNTYAYEK